jgi:two-component system, chemotaxis family, chemotaxis protein CheY
MKLRAMVLDDSRVMRGMVMQNLRHTGLAEFEFTEAEDGADGLKKFNPKNLDIMFVDWNMPNMSGIDFVRRVRANAAGDHIQIVMVTSEKTMGKIEEALDDAGANAFITKPFTVDYLSQKLTPILTKIEEKQKKAGGGFFSKLKG